MKCINSESGRDSKRKDYSFLDTEITMIIILRKRGNQRERERERRERWIEEMRISEINRKRIDAFQIWCLQMINLC